MVDTPLSRIPKDKLTPDLAATWDALNGLTGEPAFVEAFAHAPEFLNFCDE